ncbi:restriction endonuclease subunit S [Pectobacterium versatile]|uniref:restriction endonuclease subunit S n=1 Tax=Pectobacterium versatile TaxID=2488639 RepID=UPI00102F0AF2|nr:MULTISPECIES: restriction endonuclease subunit S [Pectobacterium]MBK4824846.1 hypothetical protein [Pectobacterium carotovorum subsp. carotovorum]TAJ03725.1 restriction endonuclease [Pectobacterium versatile]UNE78619.1 restriction endonuclease subunit S [Pectobacterium versatile]
MLLNELFYIRNGIVTSGLVVRKYPFENSVPFLRPASTQERTISGWVDRGDVGERNIYPKNSLFVSTNGEGSHSYSYVSSFEFSCNSDVSVLLPVREMSIAEKIFFSRCITMNRYLFSYGRKPKGKRLKSISLPEFPYRYDFVDYFENANNLLNSFDISISEGETFFSSGAGFVPVSDVFDVHYGVNLELNKLDLDVNGVNFISRTSKNNGISARVKELSNVKPIQAGVLTVAGGGSVMETFYQSEPFYSGRDLYWLNPKFDFSVEVKLFYCSCLRMNKKRYSYGRQANRTIRDILIPAPNSIPDWVNGSVKRVIDNLRSNG